jgi:hypothetical protein
MEKVNEKSWMNLVIVINFVINTIHVLLLILNPWQSLKSIRFPNLFIPYRIKVSPRLIRNYKSIRKIKLNSRIFLSGDWDFDFKGISDLFVENPKYITAVEILSANGYIDVESLSETKFLESMILKNGQSRGLKNRIDCLDCMEQRVKWYRSLRDKGFISQENLGGSKYVGEVHCAITRNGELIKVNGGNHRFAAAYILEPNFIYAHPAVIHEELLNSCQGKNSLMIVLNIRKLIKNIEKKYNK